MRVMAVWFPDWPTHAANVMAVAQYHRVKACNARARKVGICRGMRVREAQALYPALTLADWDEDRDAREFEPVVQELVDIAPSVEVLRPGLVVIDAGAAGRFYGSEDKAVELLADAAAVQGVDCMVGVADEIATAIIAARSNNIVAPRESASFLADQPIGVLSAEEALACDMQTLDALGALGVRVLGELAGLPPSAVVTRFGLAGLHCQRLAQGREERKVAPELPTADLRVEISPEELITRVDEAAFLARTLAATLHEKLKAAGVVCQRLKVIAQSDREIARVWRTREPLTEAATADRVRWQLDGWLTSQQIPGIATLALEPLEVTVPGDGAGLWGGSDEKTAQAHRVITRVQSMLGTDAVLQPRFVGGRGPVERVQLVPYGEETQSVQGEGSWPGALPAPLPARAAGHPASRLQLLGAHGGPVYVTEDVILSAEPAVLQRGRSTLDVVAWAGPWPVDEQWWLADKARRYARMQVVVRDGAGQRAFLVLWLAGQWRLEAMWD